VSVYAQIPEVLQLALVPVTMEKAFPVYGAEVCVAPVVTRMSKVRVPDPARSGFGHASVIFPAPVVNAVPMNIIGP
jgi:hypothetical protein